MADTRLGRAEQRVPFFTPRRWAGIVIVSTLGGGFVLWHLALVITAGVPIMGIGITMRGMFRAAPLSLGAKYPADSTAVVAWLLLCLLTGAGVWWLHRWWVGRRDTNPMGMATAEQTVMSAGEERARRKAAFTRRASIARGLDVETCPLNEVGSLIGHQQGTGEPLILTLEDQTIIVAPTGAGKDLHLITGVCLDAPGPLVATSTRPEMLDAIVEARTELGRVVVFDPLNMAWWPEPMVWDPTAGATDPAVASARGEAFAGGLVVGGAGDNDVEFFQQQAGIIMARLLRAAAIGGYDMHKVIEWAVDLKASAHQAVALLKRDPATATWGTTLMTAITGADDTVSGIRMTMAQKMEPLLNPVVMRQLVPIPGVECFDPAKFVQSCGTLVLLTDDQAQTNVSPLTTMFLNEVMDASKQAAAIAPTGRLDPILRIAGNELANVAPVPKLPGMLSDSRGIGVQWFAVFQSASQVLARWGQRDGEAIMGNVNCSLVMGGLQDPTALERWSTLAGEVDMVQVTSHLEALSNQASQRVVQESERKVLRKEELRQLEDGAALMIYRNAPTVIADLIPWTARPDGADIAAGMVRVRRARLAHHQARPLP